jgi:toxin ParE1/3/4
VKLRYTLPALADLESVLDYIARHSPQGARRVQSRIQTIIDVLSQHPHVGTGTSDPTIWRMTILPYPYLIFYEARDEEIIIHAVRHAARNPSDMPGAGKRNPASLEPVTGFGPCR